MSNRKKRQIIKLLNTIENTQNRFEQFVRTEQLDMLQGLLSDCQEGAIIIGAELEKEWGEGNVCVKLLEEYCELLYWIYINLEKGVDRETKYTRINDIIQTVKKQIEEKLFNTFEIVFLPYKASMWDSLESIWLAAQSDSDCICKVVSIPYYDKNPDGTFGERHMERERFPSSVPITDDREYNIAEAQPDAVFIHNPYDAGNFVTSIDPQYYSAELKKCTDILIYVPYFITSNNCSENFCLTAGVVHSDITILQSEEIRRKYIDTLRKEFGLNEKQCKDLGLYQKFIALGSPKADKVITDTRTSYSLPGKWEDILFEGGTRRKVILFNTGVDSILKHGRRELDEINRVIQLFKKDRKVVLWWRPHPLTAATLQSMRPQLYESYYKLVEQFQTEGLGIYDNTAELHRAICYSDAYYGDWSSIVYLYRITGKPVLVSDVSEEVGKSAKIDIFDFVLIDKKIWFFAHNFNYLFCMDQNTGQIELKGDLPWERSFEKYLTNAVISVDGYIVLIPERGKYITRYSIPKEQFDSIYIGDAMKSRISCSVAAGGFIYMFVYGEACIKYDVRANCLERTAVIGSLQKLKKAEISKRAAKGINCFYMVNGADNTLYRYDILTDSIHESQEGQDCKYQFVEEYNNCLFIIAQDKIVIWNKEKAEDILNLPPGFIPGDSPYADMIRKGNQLYILPYTANMILKLDMQKRKVMCFLEVGKSDNNSSNRPFQYYCGKAVGEYIYAVPFYEQFIHIINISNKEITKIPICLTKEQENIIINRPLFSATFENKHLPFFEKRNNWIPVDKYIEEIEQKEERIQSQERDVDYLVNLDGSCGEKIYRAVKTCLKNKLDEE